MKNGDRPINGIEGSFFSSKSDGIQEDKYVNDIGLTKREYFAAMAMQGLCASPRMNSGGDALAIPVLALTIADGLLKELDK